MPRESGGFMPPSESGEEQQKEVVERAAELKTKYLEMLERNKGKYPALGVDSLHNRPSQEDEDVMEELRDFFEEDCEKITSAEVGKGGNYDRDELKRLSDTLWLLRKVRAEYDTDKKEYSIVDGASAAELLRNSIEERNQQITTLQTQNQEAEKLLSGIQ
ncbi:MAG: hypothetical protein V1685_04040 [Parcubacteria group bacterium]